MGNDDHEEAQQPIPERTRDNDNVDDDVSEQNASGAELGPVFRGLRENEQAFLQLVWDECKRLSRTDAQNDATQQLWLALLDREAKRPGYIGELDKKYKKAASRAALKNQTTDPTIEQLSIEFTLAVRAFATRALKNQTTDLFRKDRTQRFRDRPKDIRDPQSLDQPVEESAEQGGSFTTKHKNVQSLWAHDKTASDPAESLSESEFAETLQAILTAEEHLVLTLRALEKMPWEDIASEVDKSVRQSHRIFEAAKKKVAEELDKDGGHWR